MTSTLVRSIRLGKTAERDGFFVPALSISGAIAIFASITQILVFATAAGGASAGSLSTTQQLSMWLVAGGLIVLLWIAYMASHAYTAAKSSEELLAVLQDRCEQAEAAAEQAHAEAARANAQLDDAKVAADQEARSASERLAQAREDADQQKARADNAEAEVAEARAAVVEATERRAEALAAKAIAVQDAQEARAELVQANNRHAEALAAKEAAVQDARISGPRTAEAQQLDGEHDSERVSNVWRAPRFPLTDRPDQSAPDQLVCPAPDQMGNGGLGNHPRQDGGPWLPPEPFRHLDGAEHPVSMADVFPGGCYLERDSVTLDIDKLSGRQVYQCRILDLNPSLYDRPHETVVSVLADQVSPLESMPASGSVTFDGLTITPFVTDQTPMQIRYSLRATAIHSLATTAAGRVEATWTTPDGAATLTGGESGHHGSSVGTEILKAAGAFVAKEVARDIAGGVLG